MTTLFSRPPDLSKAEKLVACERRLSVCAPQLSWAVDALIPADPELGMPSASEAGVLSTYLKQALVMRDDHLEGFVAAVLQLPAIRPADPIAALLALEKKDFDLFSRTVAGSFFMNEDVNNRLGYAGQKAYVGEPDYDTMFELVETVVNRGPIYTPVPQR